jgi:hypothetical protein
MNGIVWVLRLAAVARLARTLRPLTFLLIGPRVQPEKKAA